MKHRLAFLALLLVALTTPKVSFAYDGSVALGNGITLYYNFSSGTQTISICSPFFDGWSGNWDGYPMPVGNLVIPDSISHNGTMYPVISINKYAFYNCGDLTSITIPDGITSIGNNAFYMCEGLVSVSIGVDVYTIGNYAFYNCSSLNTINLPDNIVNIGEAAFSGCVSLHNVSIPTGITAIGNEIFYGCSNLESVIIPDGATSIGNGTFSLCENLSTITIPSSITSIGSSAFYGCRRLSSLIVPDGVSYIGSMAFQSVRYIEYLGTATGAPWGALMMNGYTEGDFIYTDSTKHRLLSYTGSDSAVIIPSTVDTIERYSFYNCSNLTSVYIPNNVSYIGDNAFSYCGNLFSVTMGSGILSLGNETFSHCTTLSDVNYLGSISQWCVINFPDISSNPVRYSHSLSINGNQVDSIVISDNIAEIKKYSFYNCSTITSILVGENVTIVGAQAFYGCSGLTEIVSKAIIAPVLNEDNCFFNVNPSINVVVPCGSLMSYYSRWSYFSIFDEASEFSFNAISGNDTMGNVSILSEPTCQSPLAVVNAQANIGYRFDHWSDGNTDNPRTLTLMSDSSLIGYFSLMSYDTVYIHDTTVTHDTAYITLTDTVVQYDTITNTLHDTLTIYNLIHDTITMTDTVILTHYDTTYQPVYLHDTAFVDVHDTTIVVDTAWLHDTTLVTDTLLMTEIDTLWLTLHDTIYLPQYIHDTMYIHDTVYVSVDEVETVQAKVYVSQGQIVVEGAEGMEVRLYDAVGRVMERKVESGERRVFDVPVTGVYLIRIGDLPARKVVVIR